MRRMTGLVGGLVALAALVALVAVAGLPWSPAAADQTVVVGGLRFGRGVFVTDRDMSCTVGIGGGGLSFYPTPFIGVGPAPAPLGASSVRYQLKDLGHAYGAEFSVPSVTSTTAAGMSIASQTEATGVAVVEYQGPTLSSNERWIGLAHLTEPPGGFRPVDTAGLTYEWVLWNISAATYTPEGSPATVAHFAAAHGGDADGQFLIGFGCDGSPYWTDAWRVGTPGDVTTYDIERGHPVPTISSAYPIIKAGQHNRMRSLVMEGDVSYDFVPVDLEGKGFRSKHFRYLGTVEIVLYHGSAKFSVHPIRTTAYRWHYRTSDFADGSVSPTLTLQVRTRVFARISASRLHVGQRLVVSGSTTPRQTGTRVTLWRRSDAGRVRLAAGVVDRHGKYRIAMTPRGAAHWTVYATVAAVPGNLAGHSKDFDVTVVR